MFIVPQNKKGTVAVTVLEAFLLILTMTAMMAVYEWRHSHLFANDRADQPFEQWDAPFICDGVECPKFKTVCDECGSLSIKLSDSTNAPISTVVDCARCNAPRGTLDALHDLARQGNRDLFEF
jgi:hypothetical protein